MDIAYLHLVTNHIPIIGVPFALAILLLGVWRNSEEIKAVSFLIFVVLGAVTIAVFLLGQGGEDFVEDLPGVSRDAIADHEDFAKLGLGSALVVGAASIFALLRYGGLSLLRPRIWRTADENESNVKKNRFPLWVVILVTTIAIASSGILGYTGRLGGKIRHTEFHGGAHGNAAEETDENGDRDERGRRGRGRDRENR